MKKFYKSIGLIAIMFFSFYYTEKIALIMQNQSPIMQKINKIEENYLVASTNALVEGEYIIPGTMGKAVNKTKSYVNMTTFGAFNEHYLIFDNLKPNISLEDHKTKIIKKGNQDKKAVAFLLEDNNAVKKYLITNKIPASLLVTNENIKNNNYFELINNDLKNYQNIEIILNKNNQNKNICYIKNLAKDFCIQAKKYLIEETFFLNNANIVPAKSNIVSGSIILIKKSATLDNFKILLKEINFKGLNIIPVSELIAEKMG